jgi:hypothetical protein
MNDNTNEEDKNSNKTTDLLKSKLSNFMIIIIVIFVIVVVFLVFNYLGKSNNQNNGLSSTTELLSNSVNSLTSSSNSENTNGKGILGIMFGIVYLILFIIITVLLVQYFFKVDITQPIKNMFIYKTSQNPEHELDVIPDKITGEDAKLDKPPSFLKDNNNKNKKNDDDTDDDSDDDDDKTTANKIKSFSPKLPFKEVYHVPGNHYGYEESKSVCKALGGELASIKQMEDVYKKGGGWCSYGWSSNQMALFPTQYNHWNKLQTIKGHENDCGRPGINGGYIANPNVKFGVNCYGYKPKMKPIESKLMESADEYPITEQQIAFNKQVEHWKSKLNEIIIAPFNGKKWNASGL